MEPQTSMREPAVDRKTFPPDATVALADVLHYVAADGYLGKRQAAHFLGVSIRTLEHYQGIPQYRVGRRTFYRRSEIHEWMQSHREPTRGHAAIPKSARRSRLEEIKQAALEATK